MSTAFICGVLAGIGCILFEAVRQLRRIADALEEAV